MKSLLLAAALAFAPTAAEAAVTITFNGLTFPYVDADDIGGSYVREDTDEAIIKTIDTASQTVSGSIVIDTGLPNSNTGTGSNVFYDGKGFVTLSFASSGVTPTKLTGMLSEESISSAAGQGLSIRLFSEDDSYAYDFQLFSLTDIPTSIFDGVVLPDFTQADQLFFSAVSLEDVDATPTFSVSNGFITSVTQAVPEPATWAMMLVGFGLVGTALRRRERVSVRFA
ncbi:MAG TPA: PEPxxWA-CTERM sorting domain-containing protein [Sphingomonas sp.]|jgi:hypothetical protein